MGQLETFERGPKKFADALGVSTDYFIKGSTQDAARTDFTDREQLRMFQEIEQLENEEKIIVNKFIEAFIIRKQVAALAARD